MNQGQIEQEGTPEEVYNHPANAFVYDFLGNLNLFHGRVVDGKTHLVEWARESQPIPDLIDSLIFVRPHLLEIERESNHGPELAVVKVDLVGPNGQEIHAQISHERLHELKLQKGDSVYVSPRDITVFPDAQKVALN
jgi:sulfate transport system ATP-binding protein